ncbi:hypothetical protein EVAR_40068_1 [Eumeta japonica]|uniref:Uncharacterized protein n=1 Tax=Eumeta variegata TaxID=151549 RepID=A0A4C1X349_EUMVA|nr:hypothetical protein EVAR_40068_1 [Eumeta japonica]
MDIKCNDLTNQRNRLLVLVSEMNDCRNHYEQPLLQIQALQGDAKTARLVYFGCFHSLMYGILLWRNAADIYRIFMLQNGPFAQFTSSDLVHLLEISLRKLES